MTFDSLFQSTCGKAMLLGNWGADHRRRQALSEVIAARLHAPERGSAKRRDAGICVESPNDAVCSELVILRTWAGRRGQVAFRPRATPPRENV